MLIAQGGGGGGVTLNYGDTDFGKGDDYLNETFKLSLEESEEYDTLGGLIIQITESIPDEGTTVKIKNKEIRVEKVSDRKIELVRIASGKASTPIPFCRIGFGTSNKASPLART